MYPNPSSGGFLSLIKNLKIGSILDGTQKTLGVINQAIPIIYQAKPIVNNLGTIFKISNILNNCDDKVDKNKSNMTNENTNSNNSLIFYV